MLIPYRHCPSIPFLVHRLFYPSSHVHSMPHVIPPLIFLFLHPSFFPSYMLRLFLIICIMPLSLLSVLDSGLWLQALVFDSSLVWGSSNASMIAPTMGQGLRPSCLLHWVVFSWVLCCSMEMSNTVGQRTCLNFCPTCKFPSFTLYTLVYEPEAICDYAACRDMQWLQYP